MYNNENYDSDKAVKDGGKALKYGSKKLAGVAGKQALKHAMKAALVAGKKVLGFIVVKLGTLIGGALLPIIGIPGLIAIVAAIAIFLFCALFLWAPDFAVDEANGYGENEDIPVILALGGPAESEWTREDDIELYNGYQEIVEGYKEGLCEKQLEQAEQHKLPWALLAGLDRVLGDPTLHSEPGWEPSPGESYKHLKPEFEWFEDEKVYEIDYVERETFSSGPRDNWESYTTRTRTKTVYEKAGNKVEVEFTEYRAWVEKSKTVVVPTTKIERAETYEGIFEYKYETETREIEDFSDYDDEFGIRKRHLRKIEVTEPVNKSVNVSSPHLEGVYEALEPYNLDDDMSVEIVLNVAMSYDESLDYRLQSFGVLDTIRLDISESYYSGEHGEIYSPIAIEYLDPMYLTSPFGWRGDPFDGSRRFHQGVDIGAPTGTPLYSFTDGIVLVASFRGGYGNMVLIDHGDIRTVYAHMHSVDVSLGDEVEGGEFIGIVGSTGRSTGPHLHFEIREFDEALGSNFIDPWPSLVDIRQGEQD